MSPARFFQRRHLKLVIYTVVIAAFLANAAALLPGIAQRFANFIQLQGNYDLIRNQYVISLNESGLKGYFPSPITASGAWEAGHAVPLDAPVRIHPGEWTLPKIAARYCLFPRPADDDAPYILDLIGTFKELPKGGTWAKFGSGAVLYAKAGHAFASYPSARPPAWSRAAFSVLIAASLNVLAGFLLSGIFRFNNPCDGKLRYILTCYLAGFALLHAATVIALMLGLAFRRETLICLYGGILALAFWAARKNLPALMAELKKTWAENGGLKLNTASKAIYAGLTVLAAGLSLSIAVSAVMDWDGMLHWAYQARLFFHHQGFAFAYPNLNYYPPLWSVAMASLLALNASFYDAPLSWFNALNFILFFAQLLVTLKAIGCNAKQSALALLMILAFFFHTDSFFYWTYAETVFLVFLLALIASVSSWLNNAGDTSHFKTALLWAATLSLIKLEGAVIVGMIALAALMINKDFKRCALLALVPAVLIGAWVGWISMKGLLIPISHLENGGGWAKWNYLLSLLLVKALGIGAHQLLFLLLIASALFFKPKKWGATAGFLGYAALGLALFSVLAVVGVYPERMATQLERVTPRLFVHAGIVLTLWWANVVGHDGREEK
jgi:hypothetical protein